MPNRKYSTILLEVYFTYLGRYVKSVTYSYYDWLCLDTLRPKRILFFSTEAVSGGKMNKKVINSPSLFLTYYAKNKKKYIHTSSQYS